MFISMSKWGFPHKIARIVALYNEDKLSLEDCLVQLGEVYPSHIKTVYTYENSKKVGHTCIEFGCPIVATYIFQ